MTYVHASDTSRFFVFTSQERQGNRLECKLEKVKKVPSLTEPTPPTLMKFIPMGDEDLMPSIFANFNSAPWDPASPQLATFKEFVHKEIIRVAQPAPPQTGLF